MIPAESSRPSGSAAIPRRNRTQANVVGAREAVAIAATLGATVRTARRSPRWSLAQLGRVIGMSVPRLSELERGLGARASLETWISIGIALGRPLAISFTRPLGQTVQARDAGHLEIQEYVLRLARANAIPGTFELPTRPEDPSRSTDVGLRDARHRARIHVECWNTFGDLGSAVRSTRRKQREAEATWPDDRVSTVWVVRASAANRALFDRFPNVIDAAFPGSSRAWVRALTEGTAPPPEAGVVWFDPSTHRLMERRRRLPGTGSSGTPITPDGQ